MSVSWDLFWSRAYADTPVIDPAIAKEIELLFFPGQLHHVDISSSSSFPYAKELAELFSSESSNSCSLSREEIFSGFRALATSNMRLSATKQQLGNLYFRCFIYRVFNFRRDGSSTHPSITALITNDLDLLERNTAPTPPGVQDDAGSAGTPLAGSDELQPLLRTQTTTSRTVSAFRGQGVLEWDDGTKALIQVRARCCWVVFA
jgi:hypothetical protein